MHTSQILPSVQGWQSILCAACVYPHNIWGLKIESGYLKFLGKFRN